MVNSLNLFDGLSESDKVLWLALIIGYGQSGHVIEAQNLLSQMQLEGVESDKKRKSTLTSLKWTMNQIFF